MPEDNQQQIAYNKAVQAQQLAYRLYNDARYNQRNPYISQQTPEVRKYFNYYQSREEFKIQKDIDTFKQQLQAQQEIQRLGTTTGPLTKQQIASSRSAEQQLFQNQSSKSITPIQQQIIQGPTSAIQTTQGMQPTFNQQTMLPSSKKTDFLDFIKPPTTALTPVIQEAFANQRMAEQLGLKFYNTKTPIQSIYSFVNPKGYYDLSYSQQIENQKTLQTVRQANINIGRIEQQFKTNPLSLQGFKGFESKTTKEGEVLSFKPEQDYLSNYFTFDTKTYGKNARENYFKQGFLNVVPGLVSETEMALFKTSFNVASGFHKFESAAFNLPYKETTTGYVAEVRGTPTNPLIQIPINIGALAYLSSDFISSSKGYFKSFSPNDITAGLVRTGASLSPLKFSTEPTFRIEDIYGAEKTTLKAIEINQPGKITRIFPSQKGETLFGSTNLKGYESIDMTTGIARGKFDFTFPQTKFDPYEGFISNMKTIQLGGVQTGQPYGQFFKTTGYGFNINQRDVNNIDVNFQSTHGISARQDLSLREFRLMSGEYNEYNLFSRKGFDINVQRNLDINIKTKIEGLKLYDNRGIFKSFDIPGIQRNVEYPSNLITSQQTKGFQSMSTLNLLSTQRSSIDLSQSLSQQSVTGTTRIFSGGSQPQQNKVVSGLSFRQVSSPQQYNFDITKQTTGLFPKTTTSPSERTRSGISQISLPNQFQVPKTNQILVQPPVSETKQNQKLVSRQFFDFQNIGTGTALTGLSLFSGYGGIGGFGLPKSFGFELGKGTKGKGFSYRNVKPSFTAVTLNLKGTFPKSMSIGSMNLGISPADLRLIPLERKSRKKGKKSSSKKSTSKSSKKKRR